jgi:DNA-binding response OmpR family regulator
MLIPRVQARILFIEESRNIAAPIQALLEQNGFEVDLAADPADVMDRIDQPYAIVLIDIKLASDASFTFMQWLQTTRAHLIARVIVISADAHEPLVQRLTEIGVCDLVPKPIEAETILRAIWECLEKAPTYGVH